MAATRNDPNYSGGLVATNATIVGDWIDISLADSVGFLVTLATGAGSPTATFGADVSNDPNADKKNANDAALIQVPVPLTMTAAMIAVNPPGTDTAVTFLFDFNPKPTAKFMRFNYVRASGGSAALKLMITRQNRGA